MIYKPPKKFERRKRLAIRGQPWNRDPVGLMDDGEAWSGIDATTALAKKASCWQQCFPFDRESFLPVKACGWFRICTVKCYRKHQEAATRRTLGRVGGTWILFQHVVVDGERCNNCQQLLEAIRMCWKKESPRRVIHGHPSISFSFLVADYTVQFLTVDIFNVWFSLLTFELLGVVSILQYYFYSSMWS